VKESTMRRLACCLHTTAYCLSARASINHRIMPFRELASMTADIVVVQPLKDLEAWALAETGASSAEAPPPAAGGARLLPGQAVLRRSRGITTSTRRRSSLRASHLQRPLRRRWKRVVPAHGITTVHYIACRQRDRAFGRRFMVPPLRS